MRENDRREGIRMFGWPLIFLTVLAFALLQDARRNGARYWVGMSTVFVLGLFGGIELWVALILNVVVNPPF